ncbi:SusD/RagB family nutrient-binding outer membrane lipoprotein [Maribacter thermophilus]|uniref:SusD/RagB family nutrient-binding outer membrane lipoprotein n=1 Tax=Maribacter thermophilus TaxID=1197874 RepID=UPI0006418868|nr:SusD/RagB family nutrient-binding outer membrane lipoprotein [Maribacter thermophilus]
MKNYYIIFLTALFFSCSGDLEDMNVDVKNATSAPAEAFFNTALKNMSDLESGITYGADGNPFNTTRLLVQQISSVTYNEGTTYYSNFDWSNVYMGVLINLAKSAEVVNEEIASESSNAAVGQNKLAIIELMNVYAYSKLVESFGDIPYTQALDVDNISPAYDDAETIYIDLLARLSTAVGNLDESAAGWSDDIMYDGNISGWKMFGRSLQLQMGMRIADSNPQLASDTIDEAVSGVFTSNADNAEIEHLGSQPNTNELWTDLAVGNRRDFVGAKPFIDYMNDLDDPRLNVYFQSVDGEFIGAPSGLVVAYDDYSIFGTLFYEPTTPVLFLDYATVEFLLAEAAERELGGVTDAETHYNNAIKASFEYYNVEGADEYLLQPDVAYDTAPGEWKQKIGMQKWVALFNQGLEAWTEYRRLDYPSLSAPPDSYVDTVPVRLIYPISEQTLNRANYEAAAAAIGGDLLTTKLFWDIY